MPDPTNPLTTATFLAVGTTVTHPLSTSTADYYRFTLSGRSSVNLTLSGLNTNPKQLEEELGGIGVNLTLSGLNANLDIQLLGSSGTVLQQSTNTGPAAEAVNLTDLSAGVYYLRVFAAESTNNAAYTLSLQAQRNAKTDLLWRNYNTGENVLWSMAGTTLVSGTYLTAVADTRWQLAGAADFTGDGQADLVWRNQATGQNVVWQMNGTTFVAGITLAAADSQWSIGSVDDWNGDGQADLVWRNATTGDNRVWQMQGTTVVTTVLLPSVVGGQWQLGGTGDFNRDGQTDLVWRNQATGENAVWFMQGTTFASGGTLAAVTDVNWRLEGVADFNGDNHPDLVWRNAATGQNVIWLLQGTSLVAGGGYFTQVVDLNWQIAAPLMVYGNPGVADTAGNTAATAFAIGTLNGEGNYSGSVNSADDDYYKFTLFTNSTVALALNGATATSRIALSGSGMEPVTGIDGNGSMMNVSLNAGTYYIRVYQPESTSSAYSLKVAAALDQAGDTLGTARDIATGILGGWTGSLAFADAIGRTDKDYYRFDFAQISTISLGITDPMAAANMTLIQDLNENGIVDNDERVLSFSSTGTSTKIGTLRAGTYFIEILPNLSVAVAGSLFDYKLSLRFLEYDISAPLLVPYIGDNRARDTRRRPANVADSYNRNVQFEIVGDGGLDPIALKTRWQPKQTWVILHGWNADYEEFKSIADSVKKAKPGDIVLALDWTEASGGLGRGINNDRGQLGQPFLTDQGTLDGGNFYGASWIPQVARGVFESLNAWGLTDGQNINFIGHSLGSLLSSEIAHNFGGVKTITALDPPSGANAFLAVANVINDLTHPYGGGYNDALGHNVYAFRDEAQFSRAFTGRNSIAGNRAFALLADEAYLIDFNSNPFQTADEHGRVWQTFRSLIDPTRVNLARGLFNLDDYQRHTEFGEEPGSDVPLENNGGFKGFLLSRRNDQPNEDDDSQPIGFRAYKAGTTSNERFIYGTTADNIITSTLISALGTPERRYPNPNLVGNDTYYGGKGSDSVIGDIYNDSLYGDEGNDILNGRNGNDTLYGVNPGNERPGVGERDFLTGENGADVFVLGDNRHAYYVGRGEQDYATITDFTPSAQPTESDAIQLYGRSQDYSLEVVDGDTKLYRDRTLLDLFLLQDLSGSFRDDLPIIRGLLPNLVTEVRGIQSDARFGVGSFDGYDGYTYKTEQAMNNNANNQLQTTYANLVIGAGGIESQLESLLRVAARSTTPEIGFRSDSAQIVMLITDETYQQAVSNLPTVAQIRAALSRAGIIPVFLVTSDVQADYTTLASQLDGEVVTLSNNSANLVTAIREGLINAGAGRELIAVVKDHTDLNLTADYFRYVV